MEETPSAFSPDNGNTWYRAEDGGTIDVAGVGKMEIRYQPTTDHRDWNITGIIDKSDPVNGGQVYELQVDGTWKALGIDIVDPTTNEMNITIPNALNYESFRSIINAYAELHSISYDRAIIDLMESVQSNLSGNATPEQIAQLDALVEAAADPNRVSPKLTALGTNFTDTFNQLISSLPASITINVK